MPSDPRQDAIDALAKIGDRINYGIGEGSLAAAKWRDALIDVGVMIDDLINEIEDAATETPDTTGLRTAVEDAIEDLLTTIPRIAVASMLRQAADEYDAATPPAPSGLDVERLSIAMNRATVYGTGTAEQVAAEYAALAKEEAAND